MKIETVKTWFILFYIFELLFPWFSLRYLDQYSGVYEGLGELRAHMALGIISGIVGLIIMVHCAVRKPGTKLLSFSIFMTILFTVYELGLEGISALGLIVQEPKNEFISVWEDMQLLALISATLSIGWVFFALKLRKFNQTIQIQEILKIELYQEVVQKLQSVRNLEDLRATYRESVKLHPPIAWFLKKIYKAQLASIPADSIRQA